MFDVSPNPPTVVEVDRIRPPAPAETTAPTAGNMPQGGDPKETHRRLMDCLQDEGERQAEERFQMNIDEDYNDHRHWKPEDAQVLLERGQMPLVYNQGRQTIEWLSGTEKRMRQDFKVLPREPDDEQGAEVKTHLLKYTDDANFTQYHRSAAFKQMAAAGLSWLEEGINHDPEQEIIYSGREDWRHVLRDSRGRDLLLRDWRYCFRRKRLDLDYAMALLAKAAPPEQLAALRAEAYSRTTLDDGSDMSSVWYLGQQLTNATEAGGGALRIASSFDERASFTQSSGYYDGGRRLSVDVIEAYYRVPQAVRVFVGGMFDGQMFNPADPRHRWMEKSGAAIRDAVRMRMRVMLCTEHNWLWDGLSPYSHNRFPLIPLIAYRRASDGQIYGVWRGMRDLSDDTNKRRAKALWALSANRVVVGKDDVTKDQDLDQIRSEAAQPDGVLVEKTKGSIRTLENQLDVQGNLAMAEMNINAIREMGGVTAENLGLNTAAQSGKAIIAKQEQGSLTTSDLFDNYRMAIKMQGMLRLSNLEQFYTQRKAIRIVGRGKPFEWVVVNDYDPETGEWKNDVTQRQADFEVDMQDFRASLQQAGLESMFTLLGQIATFAPQVVLSVLDLVVEAANLPQKQEWVQRIRTLNGQRDPSKAPTPQELAADAVNKQKQAKAEAVQELLAEAQLELLQAQARKMDADGTLAIVKKAQEKLAAMMTSLEIGIIATNAPHVVKAADVAADAAGLDTDGPGVTPATLPPAAPPAAPVDPAAMQQPPGLGAAPGEPVAALAAPQ